MRPSFNARRLAVITLGVFVLATAAYKLTCKKNDTTPPPELPVNQGLSKGGSPSSDKEPSRDGRSGSNGDLPSPEGAIHAAGSPQEDLEGAFYGRRVDLQERVRALEAELRFQIDKLPPDQRLSFLDEVVSAAPESVDGLLSDDRLRRALASRLLQYAVWKNLELAPDALTQLKRWMRSERDPAALKQQIAALTGVSLYPNSGLELDPTTGQAMSIRDDFYVISLDSFLKADRTKNPWLGSLRDAATTDSGLIALLAREAEDKSSQAQQVAAIVLSDIDTPEARNLLAGLILTDRSLRITLAKCLASKDDPLIQTALGMALVDEDNSDTLMALTRALARSPHLQPDVMNSVESAYRRWEALQDPGAPQARGALVRLAGAAWATLRSQEAQDFVAQRLNSPRREEAIAAASVIADQKDASWIPLLRDAISKAGNDPYTHEFVRYALKSCDPDFQEPSLLYDINQLQESLRRRPKPSLQEIKTIKAELASKREQLKRLR